MLLYAATVFLSAFLLFLVQPMIGKFILPWFGATPSVWTACMLFFQVVLLAGYSYAHLLVSRLSVRRQAITHSALLIVAMGLLLLNMPPSEGWKPESDDYPTWRIMALLAASVGVPYLLLSATGPMLQGWFALRFPGRSPYRLYALSNFGSLLALLAYPLVIERYLTLSWQARTWSIAYVLFAAACAASAWQLYKVLGAPLSNTRGERASRRRGPGPKPPASRLAPRGRSEIPVATDISDIAASGELKGPHIGQLLLWLKLPACASVMLLAVTNQMCQDVAVVPFLWVLPLALYLLTFILCFDSDRWYSSNAYTLPLFLAAIAGVVVLLQGVDLDLWLQVAMYCLLLFCCCMSCHGELVRLRPHPRYLTLYYLMISAGGALGGLFVAVIAPRIFTDYWEYHIGLLACCALVAGILCTEFFISAGAGDWPARTSSRRSLIVAAGLSAAAVFFSAAAGREELESWFTEPGWLTGEATTGGEDPSEAPTSLSEWLPAPLDEFQTAQACALVLLGLIVFAVVVLLCVRPATSDRELPQWLAWLRWKPLPMLTARAAVLLLVAAPGLAVVTYGLRTHFHERAEDAVAARRNFYGVLRVTELNKDEPRWHKFKLIHGRIEHGMQYTDESLRGEPTTYYGRYSGVGLAIARGRELAPDERLRVGVVGLGTGTIAAYAEDGDYFRFYEINPIVLKLSEEGYFTYLSDAAARKADVDVFLGDARLVLERQVQRNESQQFDVLAIDAFSSDAIPIHLLTKECYDTYWKHIKPGGVLAVHISNRFIDLAPVVRGLAQTNDKPALWIDTGEDADEEGHGASSCDWILVTDNTGFLSDDYLDYEPASVVFKKWVDPERVDFPLWTDDFSSVYDLLKK